MPDKALNLRGGNLIFFIPGLTSVTRLSRLPLRGQMQTDLDQVNWAKYRMSDFFRKPEGLKRHKKFPGTLIDKYYQRTDQSSDFSHLLPVIEELRYIREIEHPSPRHCVVHLRTGDVIDNSEFTVEEFLQTERYYQFNHEQSEYKLQSWNQYVRTAQYYRNVIDELQKNEVEHVQFVYNLNFNPFETTGTRFRRRSNNSNKSVEYVESVLNMFASANFNVVDYPRRDADYDFIYMSYSKFFVPSGGHFSRDIATVVEMRGNTVVSGLQG